MTNNNYDRHQPRLLVVDTAPTPLAEWLSDEARAAVVMPDADQMVLARNIAVAGRQLVQEHHPDWAITHLTVDGPRVALEAALHQLRAELDCTERRQACALHPPRQEVCAADLWGAVQAAHLIPAIDLRNVSWLSEDYALVPGRGGTYRVTFAEHERNDEAMGRALLRLAYLRPGSPTARWIGATSGTPTGVVSPEWTSVLAAVYVEACVEALGIVD